MAKKNLGPALALQPVPIVLATSADSQGKPNVATFAWVGIVCSDPPLVSLSIRPARHTYDLVTASGEFVLNIPTANMAKICNYVGSRSGKNEDKFAAIGLTTTPASKVKAPLIAECPVAMECVVRQTIPLGSHTMFIAEIVASHAEESVLDDRGRMVMSKVNPLAYSMAQDYWSIGAFASGR